MQNDIDIFRGIKSEIQKNPENFKPAGQWLDDFCHNIVSQEEQYIKKLPQTESNTLREIDKKKNLLKKIHKEKKTLTGKIAPYTHNDKKYKKEKKQLAELFCEANQLTLEIKKLARELEHIKVKSQEKPGFIQLMSKAFEKAACEYPPDSRKFMLIARLLTDKYLSESRLGITKYEQYVFHHEVIEPVGNGIPQLITEQEMAKDAVFAKPDAMEIIRDAYLSYENSSGKAEDTKTEDKETSSGFSVKNGQVFYDEKDLEFPAGQIQEFFEKLTANMGLTVKYTELEQITTIEKIRGYKYQASKILKNHSVPYEIISLANEGYVLRSKSE